MGSTRRAVIGAAVFVLTSALAVSSGGAADVTGATIDQDGWWNAANTGAGVPGVTNLPAPPPPVPEGSIAVGATAGEPDKVAAIGITPTAQPGATVNAVTLTLTETTDPPTATIGAEVATIVACPIISFWAGGPNGVWDLRPEFDCGIAEVKGTRQGTTWTFDLTPIGQRWLDAAAPLAANGVALVEKVDAPISFQVSFDGLATQGIGLVFDASGGPPETTPVDLPGTIDPGTSFDFDAPSGGGLDLPPVGGGFDAPALGTPTAPSTPTPAGDAPSTTPVADVDEGAGKILGNLPGGTFLLVPLALGLAILAMVAFGPAATPAAAGAAQRGVSRALAARERSHISMEAP